MKIVLASHHFPPNYQAGAELYAYRLAKGLQERGHKVVVCCIEDVEGPSSRPEVVIDDFDGLTVHRLYLNFYGNPDHIRWDYYHPALGNWFQIFFAQQQPDIVHINSGYLLSASVIEAAKKCGVPTVFTLHDYWFVCPRITLLQADGSICSHPVEPIRCTWCLLSKKRRFLIPDQLMHGKIGDAFVTFGEHKLVQKIIGLENITNAIEDRQTILPSFYETLDVVISPSSFLLQKMDEYGLKAQKAVHLPNALSMDAYTIPENRNNLKPIRFGYLGQIEPHKGIHTLVKALKKVNVDPVLIELVIYGNKDRNPKYTKYLSRLAKHFKNIRFSGTYSQDELPEILRNIDALVVPSEWYENYPTVILEAQYFKKPVIAAKIGGIPELVQDRVNGFLYSPGDVDELASIMQGIVDHPNMLTDLTLVESPGKNQVDYICDIQDIYTNLLSQ